MLTVTYTITGPYVPAWRMQAFGSERVLICGLKRIRERGAGTQTTWTADCRCGTYRSPWRPEREEAANDVAAHIRLDPKSLEDRLWDWEPPVMALLRCLDRRLLQGYLTTLDLDDPPVL